MKEPLLQPELIPFALNLGWGIFGGNFHSILFLEAAKVLKKGEKAVRRNSADPIKDL
jgi:hypothetical protein